MTPLLVLAHNQNEYLRWAREERAKLQEKGIEPRYMPVQTLNYLGYRQCLYTEIGGFGLAKDHEIYRYFESHNITKI